MGFDLEGILGDADLEMECPGCNHSFSVNMKIVLEEGSEVQCPACQANIKLQHDESVGKSVEDANRALADFEKELKRMFK